MLKFGLFLLSILLSIDGTAGAQQTNSFIDGAIGALQKQPLEEKEFLQIDKADYAFGDTIWYKAYTVIGPHHQLSALSGVLYVELISPKDSLVTRQIIPLVSGVGWSDIPLAHTLKQGSYRLRAYTNWMRNAGPDYFYNQKIRIGGIPVDLNAEKQPMQANPDVQFFPEGGNLVNGVRSRVAFKTINGKGLGQDIKGTIVDNDGNVVVDFGAQHLGMGVFALSPRSGKTYQAKINTVGGASFTVDLPKALEEGYTLGVNNSLPDSIYIKVAVNEKTFNEQRDRRFYIIAQNAGKVYFTAQGKLEGMVYTAKVEKSRFPSGIAQFTLFSQNGEPLAERIAFIQNKDTLTLKLSSPSQSYATRRPVKINLGVTNGGDKPSLGSFSVSVINERVTPIDDVNESTMLNNLLLTSDLRGFIEQPNYYFINVTDQTKSDIDVLMLTQGYRRFDWKQILIDSNQSIIYQPERSLELAGTLKTHSGKAIANGNVTLVVTKENVLRDTTTNTNGNFKFTNLFLIDTANILLKARNRNKSDNVKIEANLPNYPQMARIENQDTDAVNLKPQSVKIMLKKYTDYHEAQKKDFLNNGIQLKQVNIQSYKPNIHSIPNSSNLHGGGNADQIIMGDKIGECPDISNCLIGKILGVSFALDGAPSSRNGKMSVIVDGNILDGGYLDELKASDIYSIEVLTSGAARSIYGTSIQMGGALVITMKHGSDRSNLQDVISSGLITFPFIGYYKARTFYSPKYTGPKTAEQPADERSTIYWNPNILTDKNGKASFEYFNNDTKGTYRVVVEGIDDNGNLGRAVYRYKVE